MKVKKIFVPRLLIKHYLPHPEFYGEIQVELLNGMVTDVFTDDDFKLFTMTNNTQLIKYIKQNQVNDDEFSLETKFIRFRSIAIKDVIPVQTWMNNEDLCDNKYTHNDILLYLSHAISSNSHLFMIEKSQFEIGLAGFDIINTTAIIMIKIYEKNDFDSQDYDRILDILLSHIRHHYQISEVLCHIDNKDNDIHELLTRNHFSISLKTSEIESDLISNDSLETTYRMNSLDVFLTETEKTVLNVFFQLYPKKLFLLASQDDLIDIEFSIDYTLKTYISLILNNQLYRMSEYESIYIDEGGYLSVEANLIDRYDSTLKLLKDEDLRVAKTYRGLIFPVLNIINNQIKVRNKRDEYRLVNEL